MADFGGFPSESICTGTLFSETFISDKIITVVSYSSGTCNIFTGNIHYFKRTIYFDCRKAKQD